MFDSSTPVHVVVPAFNEASRIAATLETLAAALSIARPGSKIVVVDDGSDDETAACAREAARAFPSSVSFDLLRNEVNRGKGHAVRRGALCSTLPLLLFTDADLSTPIDELEPLGQAIARGADIAIGSRSIPGARVERAQPLYRVLMGKTFNKIMRVVTFLPVIDSQCGFKLFRQEASNRLFVASQIDGFAFDVELLFLAHRARLSIVEVPVRWLDNPDSSVHPLRHSAQMLRDVARIRWLHRATQV